MIDHLLAGLTAKKVYLSLTKLITAEKKNVSQKKTKKPKQQVVYKYTRASFEPSDLLDIADHMKMAPYKFLELMNKHINKPSKKKERKKK